MTEEKLGFDLKGMVSQKLLGYHDFITAIVTALESRDLYTEFHSMRVADMSQQICCFLGIDSGFLKLYTLPLMSMTLEKSELAIAFF